MHERSYSKLNLAYFIILACLWSGSFIGIKAVVDVWPPLFGAMIRVGIALLCLIVIMLYSSKNTSVSFSLRWKLWVIGLFTQALPFALLFWGEQLISPGLAGILNGTTSIWTFILSLVFFPQFASFSLLRFLGLMIGIVGISIIFWPMLSFDHHFNTLMGSLAVVGMAVSYALGGLLNQYVLTGANRVDFYTNIYHQHWGSFVFLVLITLLFSGWPALNTLTTSFSPWLASAYLGVFSTAVAYLIFYHLIREWDALSASLVLYFLPPLTLLWDYLFFGNTPQKGEVIGVIVVIFGIVLMQLPSFKRVLMASAARNN